jgi:hypothetical protein
MDRIIRERVLQLLKGSGGEFFSLAKEPRTNNKRDKREKKKTI